MLAIIIATICVLSWLYIATEEHITQKQYDYIKNELDDAESALIDLMDEYIELDEAFNTVGLENCSLCHEIDCLRGDL